MRLNWTYISVKTRKCALADRQYISSLFTKIDRRTYLVKTIADIHDNVADFEFIFQVPDVRYPKVAKEAGNVKFWIKVPPAGRIDVQLRLHLFHRNRSSPRDSFNLHPGAEAYTRRSFHEIQMLTTTTTAVVAKSNKCKRRAVETLVSKSTNGRQIERVEWMV